MPISKEYLPPEVKKLQSRARLYRYFEEKQVVIIDAGPGQGKTAAVYDFIKNEEKKCVWFRIKHEDSDYKKFIERLESYLTNYYEGRYQKVATGRRTERTPEDAVVGFIKRIQSKLSDDFYLILDDFEYINDATETCYVIGQILDKLSEKIKIILLTRETPNLSLARIRSRKELFELKNKDLAFTRDDIHSLIYNLYDMSFDSIVLERLIEVTEGWITGMIFLLERICCMNRKEGEHLLEDFLCSQATPEIDDYFKTQIMPNLPAETAQAIIKISAASDFTPHLVEITTGRSGFQLIKELQKTNMFITTIDPSAYCYAFNPIFKTFLISEQNMMPADERKKNLTDIADYFLEEDAPYKAVEYLCEAGEYEKAKKQLMLFAENLITSNEYESINRVLAFFPDSMQNEDSYIAYYKAVVNNLIQPETSRKKLLKLLYIFKTSGDFNREASIYIVLLTNYFFFQTNAETVGNIINMAEEFLLTTGNKVAAEQRELLKALIPLGQWWTGASKEKAFEIALRAEETSNRINNEEAFLCSRLVLSKIYIARGEFISAKNLLEKTENLFNEGSFHLYKQYQSLSSFYLGDTYFYCGEISTAISKIHKALSNSNTEFAFRPYLELNLVYYNLYLKNIDKADVLYQKLREKESGENQYLRYNFSFLFEMLLAYRSDNLHRAKYYCNRLQEPENTKLLLSDFPFSYLALAETSLCTEGPEKCIEILDQLLGLITKEEYPYPYATTIALCGYTKHLSGDKTSAAVYFKEMEETIRENKYTNIDICSPDLLKKVAEVSESSIFEDFPRLKHEKEYENISNSKYELEINTLGSFSVMVKGREISADLLGGQKRVMDLLKLLIVYRKNGVMKERIYELFWPRYSYKSARDNLNTIIYRLRKLLNDKDEFLSTDVNSIRFKEKSVITDVDRFLEYIHLGNEAEKQGSRETSTKMFSAAIELYKGDFLESDLYYDFIRDERENLKAKFRNLLFKMIQFSFNSADFREGLEWAKTLIDADPLCEPAYRMLMIASSVAGNRSEIPRLFDKLNKKLQAYYKVTADERTVHLKNKLLGGTLPDESMWRNETII
jgi:DNA-binding SARP family transcriptional activator